MEEKEACAALAEIRGHISTLWKGFRKLNAHHKEHHGGQDLPHDQEVWDAATAFAEIQEVYQDLGVEWPK